MIGYFISHIFTHAVLSALLIPREEGKCPFPSSLPHEYLLILSRPGLDVTFSAILPLISSLCGGKHSYFVPLQHSVKFSVVP